MDHTRRAARLPDAKSFQHAFGFHSAKSSLIIFRGPPPRWFASFSWWHTISYLSCIPKAFNLIPYQLPDTVNLRADFTFSTCRAADRPLTMSSGTARCRRSNPMRQSPQPAPLGPDTLTFGSTHFLNLVFRAGYRQFFKASGHFLNAATTRHGKDCIRLIDKTGEFFNVLSIRIVFPASFLRYPASDLPA